VKHARTPAYSFNASVAVVIPARYASTRLPGKPLIDLCGQPMIRRVYERAAAAAGVSRIVVATDDARIAAVVRDFGGEAVMTSPDHPTGTDRLAEVALMLDADIVVNVQGDEPLIAPEAIEAAVAPLRADSTLLMATACEPLADAADVLNPNVVKVVRNARGDALYFSRCPIPYRRAEPLALGADIAAGVWWKHTGLYAYRREFLIRFAQSPPCPLERLESLEQLRALHMGVAIRVVETFHASPGVDTPEDVERVRRTLMRAESHADCAARE
jgi:3-deoxy-manno-octulosonate cytidylyltransferase (CMP-KDO synthetase)